MLLCTATLTLLLASSCLAHCLGRRRLINTTTPAISKISEAQWQALNRTVQGRLNVGYPWARPCYGIYQGVPTSADTAQCSAVQQAYGNGTDTADNFGGYQNANWASCQADGQSCALDYLQPTNASVYSPPAVCYQGSVPNYYVNVKEVSDVQAALAFAHKTGVPLVVKNTGHDYKGRSSGPDSLALWTHEYQPEIRLNADFTPEGCTSSASKSVTVGAGQQFEDIYDFAGANNITVVGGSQYTVGAAGGWLTGGGHGVLSNTLGLGVDNALEIKAVLPNGTYITANRCQNADIFYALRGGGGNAFGVNMEVTYKAHPQLTLQVAYLVFNETNTESSFQDFMRVMIENSDKWASQGWGGYIGPSPPGEVGLPSSFLMFTPNLTLSEANATMAPIFQFASARGYEEVGLVTMPSFTSAYEQFIAPAADTVDIGLALGSRLIPRSLFQSAAGQQEILTAITDVAQTVAYPGPYSSDVHTASYGNPLQILVTTPINYAGDNTSSVTPAWRSALWHAVAGVSFSNQADTATVQRAFKGAHAAAQILRQLAPDSGAYQNEADVFEPDPAAAFWGADNYERLSRIKAAVDPSNVLTCWDCIGWDRDDERYACYPDITSS